jgi:hypothetical protein
MFSLQVLLGRVCTIAGLQSKELPIAVRTVDNAQCDCPSSSQKHVDHAAMSYLQDLLIEISKAGGGELVPVNVEVFLLKYSYFLIPSTSGLYLVNILYYYSLMSSRAMDIVLHMLFLSFSLALRYFTTLFGQRSMLN